MGDVHQSVLQQKYIAPSFPGSLYNNSTTTAVGIGFCTSSFLGTTTYGVLGTLQKSLKQKLRKTMEEVKEDAITLRSPTKYMYKQNGRNQCCR